MDTLELSSMISYDREDRKNVYRYKLVNAVCPEDVSYEEGMFTFHFFKYFPVTIDEKQYYILVNKDDILYGFGTSDTPAHIVQRAEAGEYFVDYDKELLLDYKKSKEEGYTFWITGQKNIMFDYIHHKVPVHYALESSPDLEVEDARLIDAHIEWYIEYKKYDNDTWFVQPTFCSDKEFRNNEDIALYRFVQAAVYEINGISYNRIITKEDKVYVNSHERVKKDEVACALDGAKAFIYGKKEAAHMFSGYTRIYPFNTEDSSSVFRKQEEHIRNQDCLTVTGSGDALLDLFLYGARHVTCFDINGLSKYYALLKFYFIQAGMTYQEFLSFFLGTKMKIFNKEIYDKYSSFLDENLKRFWDGIYKYLEINHKELLNSEHNLFYKIYDFFGTANQSYHNQSSYFTTENYRKLQAILQTKTNQDFQFVDVSLFEIESVLQEKKYSYAYLSNIMDFSHLYFSDENAYERLIAFKQFIINSFSKLLTSDGVATIGFIAKNWLLELKYEDYRNVFLLEEGFLLEGLKPYNQNDSIICYNQKKLMQNENFKLK